MTDNKLAEALRGLVKICDEHEATMTRILGRPADWNAAYLEAAKEALAAHAAEAAQPECDIARLVEALRTQRQIDADGIWVGVSRQACDEAAAIIEALVAQPAAQAVMARTHSHHLYRGDCPDETQPNASDPDCPACRELQELSVQRKQDARDAWQPIETAPKDGTDILVCGGTYNAGLWTGTPLRGVVIAFWDHTNWHGPEANDYDDWWDCFPTHWMPLPKPPAMAREGGR